jgi:hypothetical protein
MKKSGSVLLFAAVKVAITITLIVVICMKVDFSALARHLNGTASVYLFAGTFLLVANVMLVALRWWLILRRLGIETVPLGYALASTYASIFVGQVTPGAIGTDAMRGWLCYSRGIRLQRIVMSLVTDRVLALLGLLAVAWSAWFLEIRVVDQSVGRLIVLLSLAACTAAAFALWLIPVLTNNLAKRWARLRTLHELFAMFRFTALSRAGAIGLVLSCVVLVLTVNAVLLFARGFDVGLTPAAAYVVVPVAILSSYLPISIGGWGVREAALSYGLALFGLALQDAALLGLTLGISLLLASLPGSIVLLLFERQTGLTLRPARGLFGRRSI